MTPTPQGLAKPVLSNLRVGDSMTSVAGNPDVAELLRKWHNYAEEMRKGMRFLVHQETKEMASLQLEMAERFIGDLERLAASIPREGVTRSHGPTDVHAGTVGPPNGICCEHGNFGEPHVCCKSPGNLPPNIADLRERMFALDRLLLDPHPGLMTWRAAYEKAAAHVLSFWGGGPLSLPTSQAQTGGSHA